MPGPAGPSAVSANAGNQAVLGSDSLIFVPHDSTKYDASNPTGYITAAAVPTGSSSPPAMDGTAAAGTQGSWARGDHVHPTDTSRQPIKGTIAADNAAAGNVGEQLSVSVASPVSLTTNVTANVGSIALTPGDWVIAGVVVFTPSGAPSALAAAVAVTSATLPTAAQIAAGTGNMTQYKLTFVSGGVQTMQTGPVRVNVSANTTVYLAAQGTFTGTCTAVGYMSARRAR